MRVTRILMIASAALMAVPGVLCTFAPDVVLRSLAVGGDPASMLLVQVLGSLYMGFAALNWMGRNNLIGGIYSRPVAVANLMHFMTAGLALIKHAGASMTPLLWLVTLIYAAGATAFGFVMMRHPLPSARPMEG